MARMQRTLDQQLADLQTQRQKLLARAKALEDRKRTHDLRQRAKAEKLLLQVLLQRIEADDAFRRAVLGQLEAAPLKAAEREAVLALVRAPKDAGSIRQDHPQS